MFLKYGYYPNFFKFTSNGQFGVAIFVILSGCCLAITRKDSKLNFIDTLLFYCKRIIKLLPAYWIAIIFAIIIIFISSGDVVIGSSFTKILISILGMDGYLLKPTFPTYYVYVGEWFIGFILIMYLIFPLLHYLLSKFPIPTLIACFLISYFFDYISPVITKSEFVFWNPSSTWNPLVRLSDFAIGITIGLIIGNKLQKEKLIHGVILLWLIICLVKNEFRIFECQLPSPEGYLFFSVQIWASSLFFIIYFLNKIFNNKKKAITSQENTNSQKSVIIPFLSNYSFQAFLIHHVLVWLFINKVPYHEPYFSLSNFWMISISTIVTSYLLGYLITICSKDISDYLYKKCSLFITKYLSQFCNF